MNGTLSQVGGRWQLRFTRRLRHDAHVVWQALTEPEHLKAWFPDHVTGRWVEGGTLAFSHDSAAIPDFGGEVRVVDEPRVLEFTWGPDLLRFEIEPDDAGCTLTLFDTFDEQGKAARDAAGWHVCLDQLAADLDAVAGGASPAEAWPHINADYVEAFGPEASTIGPPEGWDDSGA